MTASEREPNRIPPEVEDAMKRRNRLSNQIAVLQEERRVVDVQLGGLLLEDHGRERFSFRYGESIVRVKPAWKRALNADGLWAMAELLATAPRLVHQGVNLNYVRWTQVEEIANDYYPGGWKAFEKQYVETFEGPVAIGVMPEHKAPKFLQGLDEGEGVAR